MPHLKYVSLASSALIGLMIPFNAAAQDNIVGMSNPRQEILVDTQPAIAPAPAARKDTRFTVAYKGSLFLIPLGKLTVTGNINSVGYAMRADMDTAGLGRIAKEQGLWSTSLGYYSPQGMRPTEHIIQKLNKKARRVTLRYDSQNNPTATINPRFGSMGVPPASAEERREAVDAMSGIMQLMMTGHVFGDRPCVGSVKIFDGKQRYNLRLEADGNKSIRQKSYKGESVRCNVYMQTVSGYDPEDLLSAEEAATPLQVYLANFEEAGLYIPVRFDYKVSGIKVNIKATSIDITTTKG